MCILITLLYVLNLNYVSLNEKSKYTLKYSMIKIINGSCFAIDLPYGRWVNKVPLKLFLLNLSHLIVLTGGRNGYGAKLCNIFSTKFTVETACKEYKHSFKQVW